MEIRAIDLALPRIETAVTEFLMDVDREFEPPLSSRLNVTEYMAKLRESGQMIGGFVGDILAGVVGFYCNDQTTHTGFITIVVVRPAFRGHGLGTELTLAALKLIQQAGMARVHLQTSATNRATRLYERIGFRTVGIASDRPGGSGIIMEYIFSASMAERLPGD